MELKGGAIHFQMGYGTHGGLVRCWNASVNGSVEEVSVQARSLDECTLLVCRGEGAYTVIPIYEGGKVAGRWKEHLDRMEESCALLGIPNACLFTQSDVNEEPLFRSLLRMCWNLSGMKSSRVRVTFDADLMSLDLPRMLIAMEPWKPFDREHSLYSDGVAVETLPPNEVRNVPRAKHNGWILRRDALMKDTGPDVYESLLTITCESGETVILESVGSNFFALHDERTLIVPEDGMLIGIARAILLESVRGEYEVIFRCPTLKETTECRELFLCSASRGLFPIVRMNDQSVGAGRPGPSFKRLDKLYRKQLEKELTPL